MTTRTITPEAVAGFRAQLISNSCSVHTIGRYLHDVISYSAFLGGQEVTSETTYAYKQSLVDREYKPSSINTILASLFAFFSFMKWIDCGTQRMIIQRTTYLPEDKVLTEKEYEKLLKAAKNPRDRLLLETLCSSGIRVSELRYFTVEAVKRRDVGVLCKRKNRSVLMPEALCVKLEKFAKERGITSGVIFRGQKGRPLGRQRIWAIMKETAERAGVLASKVHPHNLRKLFARTFLKNGGDMPQLSDVLGHSSIETTRIYIKSTGDEHRKLINSLGLLYREEETPKTVTKNPSRKKPRRGKKKKRHY